MNGVARNRFATRVFATRTVATRAVATITLIASAMLGADAHAQSQGDPQLDYMLQCQGCHLEDGTGKPDVGVPTMVGLAERFLAVPGGRAYLVQVPGVNQAPLDDRAIAELMNWLLVRYRGSGPEHLAQPYTEDEVATLRSKTPIDVAATRAGLVARMTREPRSNR